MDKTDLEASSITTYDDIAHEDDFIEQLNVAKAVGRDEYLKTFIKPISARRVRALEAWGKDKENQHKLSVVGTASYNEALRWYIYGGLFNDFSRLEESLSLGLEAVKSFDAMTDPDVGYLKAGILVVAVQYYIAKMMPERRKETEGAALRDESKKMIKAVRRRAVQENFQSYENHALRAFARLNTVQWTAKPIDRIPVALACYDHAVEKAKAASNLEGLAAAYLGRAFASTDCAIKKLLQRPSKIDLGEIKEQIAAAVRDLKEARVLFKAQNNATELDRTSLAMVKAVLAIPLYYHSVTDDFDEAIKSAESELDRLKKRPHIDWLLSAYFNVARAYARRGLEVREPNVADLARVFGLYIQVEQAAQKYQAKYAAFVKLVRNKFVRGVLASKLDTEAKSVLLSRFEHIVEEAKLEQEPPPPDPPENAKTITPAFKKAARNDLRSRLVVDATAKDIEELEALINSARNKKFEDKQAFVDDINLILEASRLRICAPDGTLGCLRLTPNKSGGTIQMAVSGGNIGFHNKALTVVPRPPKDLPPP